MGPHLGYMDMPPLPVHPRILVNNGIRLLPPLSRSAPTQLQASRDISLALPAACLSVLLRTTTVMPLMAKWMLALSIPILSFMDPLKVG